MKKIFTLIMVASIFSLVACGPSEEEQVDAEATATEVMEDITEGVENATEATTEEVELAEHVCNDKCTAEACNFTCGEKGHVCGDGCHSEGEHEHAEGEEHSEE